MVRLVPSGITHGNPRRIAALNQTRRELSPGRQIRQLRESRGLSQAQLARALRTQAPAISRIEAADYDGHSLRILRKIAAYFDQELIVAFKPQRRLATATRDRKSTRLNSSHLVISYAVFCLKKKKIKFINSSAPKRSTTDTYV